MIFVVLEVFHFSKKKDMKRAAKETTLPDQGLTTNW
jgi:hypothetical protein